MASELSEYDRLAQENAALAAKIASLKLQLGVAEVFDKHEKDRAKQLFDHYDKDKNGYIDAEEFAILALECGGEVSAITEEKVQQTFALVNTSGTGKVNFDEFWEWLSHNKNRTSYEQKGSADVNMVRLRLQSKALMKAVQAARDQKTTDDDKKAAAPSSSSSSASSSAPASHFPPEFEDEKLLNFHIALGHMKDEEAKGGLVFTSFENPAQAAATRDVVQCPEEVKAFAYLDIAMKDDADDMKMGEMLGMLEVIFDALPLAQTGFYHSHTIDVHESESGSKSLRITVFSAVNPVELLQQIAMQGAPPSARQAMKGSVRGTFKLLFPFSLDQFYNDKDLTLSGELLKFVLKMQMDVDKAIVSHMEEVMARMGPAGQSLRGNIAGLRFVQNIDLSILFGEVTEFLDHVPDAEGFCSSFKQIINGLGHTGVGHMIEDTLRGVGMYGQQHRELYNICRETLTGLECLHIQLGDSIVRLEFKGLSFVQFLPALPPV